MILEVCARTMISVIHVYDSLENMFAVAIGMIGASSRDAGGGGGGSLGRLHVDEC